MTGRGFQKGEAAPEGSSLQSKVFKGWLRWRRHSEGQHFLQETELMTQGSGLGHAFREEKYYQWTDHTRNFRLHLFVILPLPELYVGTALSPVGSHCLVKRAWASRSHPHSALDMALLPQPKERVVSLQTRVQISVLMLSCSVNLNTSFGFCGPQFCLL